MNEKLLQFIWLHQYFTKSSLITSQGDSLDIISPGILNLDQGPDFSSARIKLNGQQWAGNIELHVNSSDWIRHGHNKDENYARVILHVVWLDDHPSDSDLPVLELEPRVPSHLILNYDKWMMNRNFIPCEKNLHRMEKERLDSWLKWLASERLRKKSIEVMTLVKGLNMNWEQAFWQAIARCFGYRVNADAFERIAASLPINMLIRHSNNIVQLEALLLGQAGLLRTDNADEYPKMLHREYTFLKKKYKLERLQEPVHFLRMRPVNFPTIRLAQLAALIYENGNFFSKVLGAGDVQIIRNMFRVTANDYWHYRYRFGEPSAFREKTIGEQLIDSVMINTVIPFLYTFNIHRGNAEKAEQFAIWNSSISPEKNSVVSSFEKIGLSPKNAMYTQALLECKKFYCNSLLCLNCGIGKYLLRQPGIVSPNRDHDNGQLN